MSNYPDDMNFKAFDAAYPKEEEETPFDETWEKLKANIASAFRVNPPYSRPDYSVERFLKDVEDIYCENFWKEEVE